MAAEAKKGKPKSKPMHKLFKLEGGKIVRTNKSCPKCGPGFLLANHQGRQTCGACNYTEFSAPKAQAPAKK